MSFCIFFPTILPRILHNAQMYFLTSGVARNHRKISEAFGKTQPKGIWLYAGTTHWLFSMQNKMQRKPIWDALAAFLLTTQMYGLMSNKLSYSITEWMNVSIHHNVWREIVQISAEKNIIISLSFSFWPSCKELREGANNSKIEKNIFNGLSLLHSIWSQMLIPNRTIRNPEG